MKRILMTLMNKKTLLLFITANIFITATAHAKIYKWKDAKGITHYTSQKPMLKEVKAENIEDKIRFAAGKSRPSSDQKDKNPSNTKDTAKETSSNTKLSGPSSKLITYCKSQRKNLAQLKKNYRNAWKDETGKVSVLDQKQRQLKVNQIQESITRECSGV